MSKLPYMGILIPILTGMLIVAAGSYVLVNIKTIHSINTQLPTITVNGTAERDKTPDIATFSFSVVAEATTQEDAQSASAEKINDILAYLKDIGIEEKDINTENYNVSPKYEFVEPGIVSKSSEPTVAYKPISRNRELVGYTASQRISVTVRNLDTTGTLIAGVGERGATNISNLNFTLESPETLYEELRAEAIADARIQAKVRAKQLNVHLGDVVSYYDSGNPITPVMYRAISLDVAEKSLTTTPEIPSSDETYSINVSIQYTIY